MSDVYTAKQQKEDIDKLILKMMQNGKDINEILNMPYYFVAELTKKQNKPEEKTSLIAAFGG